MQIISIYGGLPVDCGANGSTVTNAGSATVYYRDEFPCDATTNDGSITSGSSASLTGTKYLFVASGTSASVQLTPIAAVGTGVVASIPIPLSRNGLLSVDPGKIGFVATRAMTIVRIRGSLGIGGAATGVPAGTPIALATVIADINKVSGGVATSLFTTQANRPWFADSAYDSGNKIPDVTALAAGDGLSLDVDQVGFTIQGSYLSVTVEAI